MKKTVVLTVTEACNLNCIYCYENHKSKRTMSFETAKDIIDKEIANLTEEEIEFDFLGGEPLMNFELICKIDTYLKKQYSHVPYILFITTNGTLVKGNIKEWLREKKDYFICGLSYDGSPWMQDVNRCNSSKEVDLDFFKETYPNQGIKMTVSGESLSELATGVIFLHEKGFPIACNLAYDIDWHKPTFKEILQRELLKLIDYYLKHPEIVPCSMLGGSISKVATSQKNKKYTRWCGAGLGAKTYYIDGTSYPCQFFMPLSVGEEKAKQSLDIKFYDKEIPPELMDKKCLDCVVQSVCPTCYGANYAATGNIYLHDENYCELLKIIMKARSYFKAKQWELGQLSFSTVEEEQKLLQSIQIIQKNL